MNMQRGLAPPDVQKEIDKWRVNIPDMIEVLWWPLYDYQTAAATAPTSQSFFGSGTNNGRTLAETNMELGSQIPKGQLFVCTGVQVEFYPGTDPSVAADANTFVNDVYDFYRSGALKFKIGSKNYIEGGNLLMFAPVNRLGGFAASSSITTGNNAQYATAAGREYALRPVGLESSQNFDVKIVERLDLPSTTDGTVGVKLNGYLARNAQ